MLEGGFQAAMVGVAESYLGAFAVELGHSGTALAAVASLPLLAAAGAQLAGPRASRWLGGRKHWVVACAALQALSLGGFAWIALTQQRGLWPLLLTALAYWSAGGALTPAWNAWMSELTRGMPRAQYFARRSALAQLVLLVSFGAAGIALRAAGSTRLDCFSALFLLALGARGLSAMALALQPEACAGGVEPPVSLRPSTAGVAPSLLIPVYVAALALGTHVSAPFFTPYMLRELKLDYGHFAGLLALSVLSKCVAFHYCARVTTRRGQRKLLLIAAASVALVPALWAISSSSAILVFVQIWGGAAWAGVEYASFQLLMAAVRAEEAAQIFALSSALSGVGQVAGSLLGGTLLQTGTLNYRGVFALSALLRLAPLGWLLAGFFPRVLARLPSPQRLRAPTLRTMRTMRTSSPPGAE
jgi:MFS family permease